MGKLRNLNTILVVATVGLTACTKKPEPDAFLRATVQAANGEPQALWAALPPSYQKDVEKLFLAFGEKMDPAVYDAGFVLLQKAVKVLETKKSFVLAHPQMKQLPLPPDAISAWDPAVHALSRILGSELSTVAGLKKLDVSKLLSGPIAESVEDLVKVGEAASSVVPGKSPKVSELRNKLASSKITVLSVEGDTAKVQVEAEGEKPETLEMVKLEERWVPKQLVDAWPSAMAEAHASIKSLEIPAEAVIQFNAMKGVLGPVLDGLLAAKTQSDFDAQIETAMKATLGPMLAQRPSDDESTEAYGEEEPAPAKKRSSSKSKKRRGSR